jgi:16S rRNA (cytidine1402-2'-O)-methyltransferase
MGNPRGQGGHSIGTLYIVATPIGNLEDITLRAARLLGEVSLIATEDTRATGRLLSHLGLNKPLLSYYEHNELRRLERVLEALAEGDVALVSEAGMPLLSDPGYELVRAAIEQGFPVVPIPGPSAPLAALVVSGLPVERFLFVGFLPRKKNDRRRLLEEVATQPATLVCFEAPHRLPAALTDMAEILGEARAVAVCRELTKLHEEVWRGDLAKAQQEWAGRAPRGEFTLVVAGAPPPAAWSRAQVEAALAEALAAGDKSTAAARKVAAQSGWPKSEVYALAHRGAGE